ncbi:hypothetical protein LOK49_LG12G00443 [Camellia lanceoleosa]|uniref:Uncharacterized protein n=1 Tax=Camellia lanceoleosa TaxID=1840588 RepID=A0ACC0FQ12_9ERIC|nr:hypothetical protein LOK49_LG12G00443 [Camellia lanceoleosa]
MINMHAYHAGGHILMNQILGIARHGSLEMKIAQRYEPSLSPIDRSESELQNIHIDQPDPGKLTSLHFYAWSKSNVLLSFFWSWIDCCGCLLLEASFRLETSFKMIYVTGRTTIIYAMVLVDNLQESGLRRSVHHYAAVASGLGG